MNNITAISIGEKYMLTIKEAAQYFHIGQGKLRQIISENPTADFILWIGNRSLIKRCLFEKYIDGANAV